MNANGFEMSQRRFDEVAVDPRSLASNKNDNIVEANSGKYQCSSLGNTRKYGFPPKTNSDPNLLPGNTLTHLYSTFIATLLLPTTISP